MAKCPYCRKPVTLGEVSRESSEVRAIRKEIAGAIKKEVMYVCPHCDCVLGFGFFLGGLLTGRPK